MREARRADGATIDPGGSHGDEESAVKARIATAPRPVKDVPRQTRNCFHTYESSRMSRMLLAIFGCSTAYLQVERGAPVYTVDEVSEPVARQLRCMPAPSLRGAAEMDKLRAGENTRPTSALDC